MMSDEGDEDEQDDLVLSLKRVESTWYWQR